MADFDDLDVTHTKILVHPRVRAKPALGFLLHTVLVRLGWLLLEGLGECFGCVDSGAGGVDGSNLDFVGVGLGEGGVRCA